MVMSEPRVQTTTCFFDQPQVEMQELPFGEGVRMGTEQVAHPEIGMGGVYGTWGEPYDNAALQVLLEQRLGEPLDAQNRMNLSELGFISRHHLTGLSPEDHLAVEVEVGARILRQAAQANGWNPDEVQGVLIGLTGPASDDYVERIAEMAGIPSDALKVSIHKACDGSVGGLHLALNPDLTAGQSRIPNFADILRGKKVLVGGIEGLSRFMKDSRDKNALQLFGSAAGVIGLIPGKTIKFLVGKTREVFDEEGVLKVHMYYPHSGQKGPGGSMLEVSQVGANHYRFAGLMHQPTSSEPVEMAGPMGMVKLFVRTGVEVVQDLVGAYHATLERLGSADRSIAVAIVHHANYKINKLIEKHLNREGIQFPMPWLLSEFGNVSAASNMIAFLRKLASLRPGDHVLIDGFGAGTYYDALVVEMGG